MNLDFEKTLSNHRETFQSILRDFFEKLKPTNEGEKQLLDAMKYATICEVAKYIRSFLSLECYKILKGEITQEAINIAIAVEFVHAYSLIHDDLPSMDNSDFRRGKPALHKKFKESTALMAGNSLLTMAFEILEDIKIVKLLASASGAFGIMSGQVLDLDLKLKEEGFEVMNYHKTGKLFEFCMISSAVLAKCNKKKQDTLAEYGRTLGTIFQMTDDILDEGEGGMSYLSIFSKDKLLIEIEKNVYKAKNLMYNFRNSASLLILPEVIAKRSF